MLNLVISTLEKPKNVSKFLLAEPIIMCCPYWSCSFHPWKIPKNLYLVPFTSTLTNYYHQIFLKFQPVILSSWYGEHKYLIPEQKLFITHKDLILDFGLYCKIFQTTKNNQWKQVLSENIGMKHKSTFLSVNI